MDVTYDFEDMIDDLILRFASKLRRIGNWKWCLMLIKIHKKMELIKSKIPYLLGLPIGIGCGGNSDNNFEEIIWSDILSIEAWQTQLFPQLMTRYQLW